VLKSGKCTACHNPHASQASHLLKAEGDEACYQCHNKEDYQKKVVHKASPTKGCMACHYAALRKRPLGKTEVHFVSVPRRRPPFRRPREYPVERLLLRVATIPILRQASS
jgi:predicted CXXCH cytochrome family protein